ncbi:unnamed protein product, partial [Ixodes persulcatus]
ESSRSTLHTLEYSTAQLETATPLGNNANQVWKPKLRPSERQ